MSPTPYSTSTRNRPPLDLWLDSVLYLALKARANAQERTVSQHLRYLVRQDLDQSLADEDGSGMGHDRGEEGEE